MFLGDLDQYDFNILKSRVNSGSVVYWASVTILTIAVGFAVMRLADAVLDASANGRVAQAEPSGGQESAVDIDRVSGLFGRVPRNLESMPTTMRAENVFDSLTVAGIAWRGDSETSVAIVRAGRDTRTVVTGALLEDGTEISEIGRNFVGILRGTRQYRIELEMRRSQQGLPGNGNGIAPVTRPRTSEEALAAATARITDRPPPEVRRRKTGVQAQDDPRLQQLRKQSDRAPTGSD